MNKAENRWAREKTMLKRALWSACLMAATALFLPAAARAEYPEQNITIVVPYPPGSTADLLARLIGQHITTDWGKQVIVDNRPGAGGSVGADYAAHVKPDGYTLLLCTNSPLTTNPSLYKSLHYDALKDFQPVGIVGGNGMVVVAAPSQHLKTFKDLIDLAKEKPGAVLVGTSGNGTTAHMTLAQIDKSAGVTMTHVPYNGGVPSLTAAVSGEVQVTISDIGPALPLIRDGRLVALASTSKHRPQSAPNIPTIDESGFPGLVVEVWFGLLAPHGTPDAVVQKLNGEINHILADHAVQKQFIQFGTDPQSGTVQSFEETLKRDIPIWAERVKSIGLSID